MRLGRLISHQWWKTTVLVIAVLAVMVRLGFWQLDRLDQRREFNSRVEAQLAEPTLELVDENLELDLYNMEYRDAIIVGEYDHERQVVLRNQDWQGRLGVHLITPLMINGSQQAILVDRGWVPYEDFTAGTLDQFDQPGLVEINGTIRRSQTKPLIGGRADPIPAPGEAPLKIWNWINVSGIAGQMPYDLLPVYLMSSPSQNADQLPYRSQLELDLSEGSHLGYAFQWFIFAAILGIGYPLYIRKEETRLATPTKKNTDYIQSKSSESSNLDNDNKGYDQA
jgi:surfeit locus 1 family protein